MASHLERCLFPGEVTGGEEGENWWFNIILNTIVLGDFNFIFFTSCHTSHSVRVLR